MFLMEFKQHKNGLRFTAVETNSSIRFNTGAVTGSYIASTNDTRWFDYTIGDTIYLPNVDDSVVFRAKTNNVSFCPSATVLNPGVTMTGKIAASGNIQYLLDNTGKRMDVSEMCYYNMFKDCSSLEQSPNLPATNLAYCCYYRMFFNCTSLIQAPKLPAIVLSDYCYGYMFFDCISLLTTYNLPATNLSINCYHVMFYGCKSLRQAPKLPAEELTVECYRGMFYGCKSLMEAPELPAIYLSDGCYKDMFYDCPNFTNCHMKVSMTNVYDKTVHGDTAKTVIFDIP